MFHNADYKYFQKAKQVADISDYRKTHIGCVAVYMGQVIGLGCNCNKTHPTQYYYNRYRIQSDEMLPKLHAEISCLNQIKHLNVNFSKIKLYIYRIRKDQPFGMARPCPSCMAAIRDLEIKDIYYTSNDRYVHEKLKKYNTRGVS
ncbi:deaminase [uncultured Thomasclavelia sp.]|uniref:deaminase n=1 Tax=uncultured Thomasclavelia sp. TaxID=3025759 RepID=UPI0035A67C31